MEGFNFKFDFSDVTEETPGTSGAGDFNFNFGDNLDMNGFGDGDGEDAKVLESVEDWSAIMSDTIFNSKEEKVDTKSALNGKVVGVLIAASFSDAEILTSLQTAYGKIKEAHPNQFEIVLVAAYDIIPADAAKFVASHPWLHCDMANAGKVADRFFVNQVPCMFLYDSTGKHLTSNGVSYAVDEPEDFPWSQSDEAGRVTKLGSKHLESWLMKQSVVLMMDNISQPDQDELLKNFQAAADTMDGKSPLQFYYCASATAAATAAARGFIQNEHDTCLAYFDMPKTRKFLHPDHNPSNLTTAVMLQFIQDAQDNKLVPQLVSEDRPENDCDPETPWLKTIVGLSFEDLVIKDEKTPTVVYFYSEEVDDDSEHVSNVAKALNELNNKTVFGVMNVDKNEIIEQLELENIPTLRVYPPGSRSQYIDMDDEITAGNLLSVLKTTGLIDDEKKVRLQFNKVLLTKYNNKIKEFERLWKMSDLAMKKARELSGGGSEEKKESKKKKKKNKKKNNNNNKTNGSAADDSKGPQKATLEECIAIVEMILPPELFEQIIPELLKKFNNISSDKSLSLEEWHRFWKTFIVLEDIEMDCDTLLRFLRQEVGILALVESKECTFTLTKDAADYDQPFFLCKTCSAKPGTGVCYACSKICHEGHDVTTYSQDMEMGQHHVHDESCHHDDDDDDDDNGDDGYDDMDEAPRVKQLNGDTDELNTVANCYCDCGAGTFPSKCKAMTGLWDNAL